MIFIKKKIIFFCAILLLILLKFFIGVYQDDEFSEEYPFLKHRPVWQSYFYSPRGMSDKSLSQMSENERFHQVRFDEFILKKTPAENKFNALSCGDLLTNFGFIKPEKLSYIGCERMPHVQKITTAEYHVSGEHSQDVEDYFIKHFNMPALKIFVHTGWEPSGYGTVKVDALSKIDANYELMVEMWGYARRKEETDFRLLPRNEVPVFRVLISIVDI